MEGDGSPISCSDDLAVLARVRAGDRDAYAELVRRYAPVALRTAALLGAGPDAEDVVQEAFVKAYSALGRFREGAAFRPWLLQIVTNETRNLHRSAGRRAARLSEVHRQVVVCRYLLDLDEADTATVLALPRGTVKSRLHRALRELSSELARLDSVSGSGHEAGKREVGRGT